MLKIAPLIDLFFPGASWAERAAKIAACGFEYIETWRGENTAELKEMISGGVELVSVVLNFDSQSDVAPVNPANRAAFVERVDRMADSALAAGCRQGIVTTGRKVAHLSRPAQRAALVAALAAAGERVADRGFQLNVEVLNTEVDHAGYFLDDPADAVAVVKECGRANVKVLYDFYHMTIMRGDQTEFLRHNLPYIGHFHAAGTPGRHEPEQGELNYPFVLGEVEKLGYTGFIGLEYHPLLECAESLRRTKKYFTAK